MQQYFLSPSPEMLAKAKESLKLMDQKSGSLNSLAISKVAKNIKSVKPPVARYFDSPAQVSSYYAEGEYDLVSIFKLLKYESYFQKSVNKKLGLLTKSGFDVHSNNDAIKAYINFRFRLMKLQTGISREALIRKIAFYLITCSNCWIVKVRDKDFEYASSYEVDGKELHPVVGYFIPHPTTMKPRFKYVKDTTPGAKWQTRLELDKWVHINRRGIFKYFELEDVAHFTLFKEDGMIFGTPEIIPVIDDIRVLRKIEEDAQLLTYRDLFPIIHYSIENPKPIDHTTGYTELDQAQVDMQRLMQDGGIATDKRHEIKFVGNESKGVDGVSYLNYFQQRVFTGLGVSPLDMGIGENGGGASGAQTISKQITDSVKSIQQEISDQFQTLILDELAIQSPFNNVFDPENEVSLKFDEIDIEWKIRKENHEADLFTKGINPIHETRNLMGKKDVSDDDLAYTHPSMYGEPANPVLTNTKHGDDYIQKSAKLAKMSKPPQSGAKKKTSSGGSSADASAKINKVSRTNKSSADSDTIKKSKTNSNTVKHKDELYLSDEFVLQDMFKTYAENVLKTSEGVSRKVNLMMGTKVVYDLIKKNMSASLMDGVRDACNVLGIEEYEPQITSPIFEKVDSLRDLVTDAVNNNPEYLNRASLRISTANKTETTRAYNYGVAKACLDNGVDTVEFYSDFDNISEESSKLIGATLKISKAQLLEQIPPFHPNSRLKIKPFVQSIEA